MKLNPYEKEGYVYPVAPCISRMKETAKLYKLEDKVIEVIKAATEEFKNVYVERPNIYKDFWKECLPEELRQTLNRFDSKASELAAISYLQSRGYEISKIYEEE
jgi:hypothetical protein